jgi:hypothetical protein
LVDGRSYAPGSRLNGRPRPGHGAKSATVHSTKSLVKSSAAIVLKGRRRSCVCLGGGSLLGAAGINPRPPPRDEILRHPLPGKRPAARKLTTAG